jgi:hypothetical protein
VVPAERDPEVDEAEKREGRSDMSWVPQLQEEKKGKGKEQSY